MTEEPTVLDFVKSLLTPWRGKPLKIPADETQLSYPGILADELNPLDETDLSPEELWIEHSKTPTVSVPSAAIQVEEDVVDWAHSPTEKKSEPDRQHQQEPISQPHLKSEEITHPKIVESPEQSSSRIPWRSLLAITIALFAQRSFEPLAGRKWETGVILFFLAIAFSVWASWQGEWLPVKSASDDHQSAPYKIKRFTVKLKRFAVTLGVFMGLVGIFFFPKNLFTSVNLFWQFSALVLIIYGFWLPSHTARRRSWRGIFQQIFQQHQWNLNISRWTIALLCITAVVAFFRFSQLNTVPPEMTDDHAEKILDIARVLQGQTNIFFPNNGGREGLEMYLIAALQKFTGHELDFMLLKIATSLVGFLTLPFIYMIGKEIGNRRVGLLAFAFAGVSYWGNLVSRVGLRLPFYFLFTATTLYFLLRGLRTLHRNDFILAGVSLGFSMYGYTADRILPLVVLGAFGIFLLHRQATGRRKQIILMMVMLFLITLVIFVPLLRYLIDEPGGFLERTITRMGSAEQPLSGPAWKIFLQNLWRAVIMFSWGDGEVWLVSVTHRPALDIVTGALFWLGVALLLVRYLRQKHWRDIFLILSIPLLMLPSILALAFPNENPNLYRTGGALIPVFLIIALALDGLMRALGTQIRKPLGLSLAWGLALFLFVLSASQSHDLVFNQWFKEYRESSWNTTEMAQVIQSFAGSVGSIDTAWLVGYPYWAGSRVLGIAAGYPTKDFAIWTDQLETTLADPRPKLFLLSPQDQADVDKLSQLYPEGWVNLFKSSVVNKDFLMFFVPPTTPSGS